MKKFLFPLGIALLLFALSPAIVQATEDISATKRWDHVSMFEPGMAPAPTTPPDIWLKLARKSSAEPFADVPNSLITLTAGDYNAANEASHTWTGLPSEDPLGNPYAYSVVETNATGTGAASPTNYMVRIQKDAANPNHTLLTNIYLPIQNGNRSTLPCHLDWYADATIDNTIQDPSNHFFQHKVSNTLFGEESGYFAMHHWGGSKVGDSVFWRIPLATNHDIVNGRLVIPFDDPDFVPDNVSPLYFYTEQWRFNQITFHTLTPDPVNSYTLLTSPDSPITNPAPSTRPSYTYNWDEGHTRIVSLSMDIPFMPAMSAYMIQISGKIVNAATADNPDVNYHLGASFSADYNCVVADKVWTGGEPAELTDVLFELYADGVAVPTSQKAPTLITLEDNSRVLRAVWTKLPFNDAQNKPIDFTVKEIAVAEGYKLVDTQWKMELAPEGGKQHIKHYSFTNMLTRDITGIKRWVNDTEAQRSPIYLMVAERVKDSNGLYQLIVPTKADHTPLYGAIPVDLTMSEFSHSFTGLPTLKPDGTPIEYTVVEARNATGVLNGTVHDYDFGVPLGYARSTQKLDDGSILITNTRLPDYEPVKDGDHSQPCEINWYTSNVRDRFSNVEPTRDKVSSTFFALESNHATKPSEGVMVLQSWPANNWRTLFWRVIMGTNNELHEGSMTIDLSALKALGMLPVKGSNGSYIRYDTPAVAQNWLDRGAGLDAAYNKRYSVMDMSSITESLSADSNTLTLNIPQMDKLSIIVFSLETSLDPAIAPVQDYYLQPLDGQSLDGTRYAMSAKFKAQTRCAHVEKTWLGQTDGSEEVLVRLTLNGTPLMDTAREKLEEHLGTSFTDNAPTSTLAYRQLRDWINEVDKVVPGFFSAMAKNPGTPMKEQLWVDWSANPPSYHNYSYTFDQAQLDLTLEILKTFYEVTLTQANGYQYTFGQLPWETPEAYSVVETNLPAGWVQQGEVARDMNEWRVILGLSNRQSVDIVATKTWSGGPVEDHTEVELTLTRQIAGGAAEAITDPAAVVTGAAPKFTYTWTALPTTNDEGKAYTYRVTEAGAVGGTVMVNGKTYTVTQTNNDILNSYEPPSPSYPTLRVPLTARKTLQNGSLKGNDFSFELRNSKGALIATVQNAADGSIVFPDRTFSKEVNKYLYTIQEVKGSDSKFTYDTTVYTVKVTTQAVSGKLQATVNIEKNGIPTAGGMVFTNKYKLPQTGDSVMTRVMLLISLSLVLGAGAYALNRRVKNKASRI